MIFLRGTLRADDTLAPQQTCLHHMAPRLPLSLLDRLAPPHASMPLLPLLRPRKQVPSPRQRHDGPAVPCPLLGGHAWPACRPRMFIPRQL